MVDVMHTDVGGEPAQHTRQVIMRASMQRRLVKIPVLIAIPEGVFELVLERTCPRTPGLTGTRPGNSISTFRLSRVRATEHVHWHFYDIHVARFNVWFWTLFGHRRMSLACRLMTQSGRFTPAINGQSIWGVRFAS
jgi:hypothetical protein